MRLLAYNSEFPSEKLIYLQPISQRFTDPRMRNVHRFDTQNIFEGLFKTIDFIFHSNLIRKFAEGVAQNGILIAQMNIIKSFWPTF